MGIQDVLRDHPAVGGLVGGVAIGVTSAGIVNIIGRKLKKRASKKKTTKKRKDSGKKSTSRKSKPKTKSAASKRRARAFGSASSKKIFTTKKGQPYILLKNGKARFISKKSAKTRKKRKGGFR